MLPAWTKANTHISSSQHRVWFRRSIATREPRPDRGSACPHAFGGAATGIRIDPGTLAELDDSIGPLADQRAAAELCRRVVLIAAWWKGNEGIRRLMHCRLQKIPLVGLPLQTLRLTGHHYPLTSALRAKLSAAAARARTEAA